MVRPRLFKKTQRDQVCDRLCQYITSPQRQIGERLAPVRKLARHFDTSPTTIKQALAVLEERGYIVKRPRSGTFINAQHRPLTMADSVAVCTEASGHVWSDMTQMLLGRLHERHLAATLVDPRYAVSNLLMRRMWLSEAACLVVRGASSFPYNVLKDQVFQRKPIVALIDWESKLELPQLHRVLIDHARAAQLVTEHLAVAGHRRVLIVGTQSALSYIERTPSSAVASATYPSQLVAQWEACGGAWRTLSSHSSNGSSIAIDEEQLLAIVTGDFAPTAVVGLRDVEAAVVQRALRQHRPELLERIAMVGYYDTPWSVAGHPPITTVNLNLPELIDAAVDLIDRIISGQAPQGGMVTIAPRLVVRQSSSVAARSAATPQHSRPARAKRPAARRAKSTKA